MKSTKCTEQNGAIKFQMTLCGRHESKIRLMTNRLTAPISDLIRKVIYCADKRRLRQKIAVDFKAHDLISNRSESKFSNLDSEAICHHRAGDAIREHS